MTTQSLSGRIALVTGASRGIGYACALGLAEAGAHVIAVARTQGGLEELDDAILAATGDRATLVPADITDGDGLDRLGAAIYERWGRLDVMMANAGELGLVTPVAHLDPRIWERAVAVNLTASFRLIRAMDPLLRRAEAGRAIFVTTGAVARPRAFWGAYTATKAGLEGLVKVYADEVEHTSIRCALLNPGPMRTRMRAQAFPGEDPNDLPPPEDIVPLVLELASPDREPPQRVVNFADWAAQRGGGANGNEPRPEGLLHWNGIAMTEQKDDLAPTTKDPAEGARGPATGGEPAGPGAREESHLGAGGDPAEGQDVAEES